MSSLCLGGMNFGSWAVHDHGECERVIHAALDAGINFIDTADAYSDGESEVILGKAISSHRERVVLATKFNSPMGEDPNRRGNSRRWVMLAVEASLRRLGTDWIDLYQVHRPDDGTELEETIDALTDLVHAGKIRYFGTSTFSPHRVVEALWVADRRHLVRVATEQPPYSLLARRAEGDLFPVCSRHGLGVLCWSPLAGGWLSGQFSGQLDSEARSRRAARMPRRFDLALPANQAKLEAVEALAGLAAEAGLTLPELAISFVLQHPAVTSAIIGPRTTEQVTSLLGAAEMALGRELLDRVDEIVAPGTTVNPADDDHRLAEGLVDVRLRRRPTNGRI